MIESSCAYDGMESQSVNSGEELKWTAELEVALFHSMHGHKPVGLNKHFHMLCIQHRLQQSSGFCLSTRQIWEHLRTLYDLDTLDEFERFPFPNEERDFSLPEHLLPDKRKTTTEGYESEVVKMSTSPSPVSSPLNRTTSKRKRVL